MSKVREQLGFLVHIAEMFNHYGAVWKHMSPDEFEIVVTGSNEERARIHRLAADQGYRAVDAKHCIQRHERYRHLVSNHCLENINGTPLVQILGEYNIRFMYALGEAKHTFADWNRLYNMPQSGNSDRLRFQMAGTLGSTFLRPAGRCGNIL